MILNSSEQTKLDFLYEENKNKLEEGRQINWKDSKIP